MRTAKFSILLLIRRACLIHLFQGFTGNRICGPSGYGSRHGTGFHSAVTTCRLSGLFLPHGRRQFFRRQAFCLYLRHYGTTRHLLLLCIHGRIHILSKGYDRSILLLFPRCQTPGSHPRSSPVSQTPDNVCTLSCITVERNPFMYISKYTMIYL